MNDLKLTEEFPPGFLLFCGYVLFLMSIVGFWILRMCWI